MNLPSLTYTYFSACSDVGLVRTNNEDNLYCNGISSINQTFSHKFHIENTVRMPCIFAICDGMGGEAQGELASLTVVNLLNEYAEKIKSQSSSKHVNEIVQSFISDANNRLCKIMREKSLRMGTTLALVIISEGIVYAYNIGDSRIYKFKHGMLSRISEDHTIATQKIKMGLLDEEQARHDKSRHVLTRCIGIFDDEMILTPYIIPPFSIDKECRLLLCSDGLTDMLPDTKIESIMLKHQETSSTINALVDSALQNGGRDNITCIIIDFKIG